MKRTITLKTPMTFSEALTYMLEGKCLGIRPQDNTNYIELYNPNWMRDKTDYQLRWNGSEKDFGVRVSQLTGDWFPVIADHRELKEKEK